MSESFAAALLTETIAARTAFIRLLTSDPTGDAIMHALVRGPLHPYRAGAATLFLPDDADRNLVLAGSAGTTDRRAAAFRVVPLDLDLPLTRAYLTGQTLFVPQSDWAERFPPLRIVLDTMTEEAREQHKVMVCGPLLYQGVPRGVVNFSLADDRRWVYDDYTYLDGLLAAIAMWARIQQLSDRLEAAGLLGVMPHVRTVGITDRQRVILTLLDDSKSNDQIARALGFSISTVKNDLQALMNLLGARDRHDIVTRARESGLLTDSEDQIGG